MVSWVQQENTQSQTAGQRRGFLLERWRETHLDHRVQTGRQHQVGQFVVVQSCSFRRALAAGLEQLQQGFQLHTHTGRPKSFQRLHPGLSETDFPSQQGGHLKTAEENIVWNLEEVRREKVVSNTYGCRRMSLSWKHFLLMTSSKRKNVSLRCQQKKSKTAKGLVFFLIITQRYF